MARRRKHYPSYPSHPEVQTFQEGVECMDARRLLLMFSDTYGNLSPVESYADLAEMAAQHRLSGDGVLTPALKKAQNLGWIERLERGDTILYRLGTLGRLELQRLLDDENWFERSCLLGVVDD